MSISYAREALSAVVCAYAALIVAALPDTRKALRQAQKLRAYVRGYLKTQASLYRHALREELRASPALRAQVSADLGGARAMRKWEARRHCAIVSAKHRAARGLPEPQQVTPIRPSASPRKIWRPRTDRRGHFRLAIIPTKTQSASGAFTPWKSPRKICAWGRLTPHRITFRLRPAPPCPLARLRPFSGRPYNSQLR